MKKLAGWLSALALVLMGLAALGPAAHAVQATSASLTMASDPGDYIGGGQSYSYSTAANDAFNSSGTAGVVDVSLTSHTGDWWDLDFAAPSGQSLTPNTSYDNAVRYPFQGTGAGLNVDGEGRGCNTLTGSFHVVDIQWGPNNYLKSFRATFTQHCEGADPALTGEIQVTNPEPPPALGFTVTVDPNGAASRTSGQATVHGTVACTKPATVYLSGTVDQRASRTKVSSGSFTQSISCGTAPVAWTATVASNSVPYNPGKASVSWTASGFDSDYNQPVNASGSTNVSLTRK